MIGMKNNLPKDGELNGRHENSSLAQGMDGTKITRQKDG